MTTRTINISLLEQIPQFRTLRFEPRLASVDGDLLLQKAYVVTTDVHGDATLALPVKASGSLRYDYEIPRDGGKSKGHFFLEAGSAIDLDDLIAAGGVATDSVIEYVDEAIAEAIAEIPSEVSDAAYNAATWNGVASIAPSKNAIRDEIEALKTLITNLVAGAPGTLDTLNELAAALGDDENFATTITNLIAEKQSLSEKDQPGGYPGLNGDNAIATNHLGQELRSHSIVHEKVSSYPEKTVSVDGDGNILANKLDETSGFFVIDGFGVTGIKSIRSDEQAFVHGDVLYLRNGTSADLVLKNNDGGTGISLIWASPASQWVFPPDAMMLARFDGNANRFYVSLIFGTPESRFGPTISGDITIDSSNWFEYMDKWVIVAPSGNLTITINDVPSNFSCTFYQRGSNDSVVIASSSYSLRNRQSHDKLAGEFAVVGVKVEDTNGDLIFFGDTKA